MKGIFISYYQAFHEEVVQILDSLEIRGYTFWPELQGRGSSTGEPHYGSHAWPTLNSACLCFVADEKVRPLQEALHQLDLSAPQQGLHCFIFEAQDGNLPA